MTKLQSLLSALVRDTQIRQIAIASRAGLSVKHLSQMLNGRVEGTLTMWQAVLDAAGVSLLPQSRGALEKLADEWRQAADEDERYLNRAHASEIHDVYASIRINREHAAAVLALLDGTTDA